MSQDGKQEAAQENPAPNPRAAGGAVGGDADGPGTGGRNRPDLEHHARLCSICHHPRREEIERDFYHWRTAREIVSDYHLPGRSSLYRHAHATGLYDRRVGNLRGALDHLLDRAGNTEVNANAIVRAVAVYARISSRGAWVNPPTTHIVYAGASAPATPEEGSLYPKVNRDI